MQRRFDGLGGQPTRPAATPPTPPAAGRLRVRWRVGRTALKSLFYGVTTVLVMVGLLYLVNASHIQAAWFSARHGVDALNTGANSLLSKPADAQIAFSTAGEDFQYAASSLKQLDSVSKSLFVFPVARENIFLLRIGNEAAQAGEGLSRVIADRPPKMGTDFATTAGDLTKWVNSWRVDHQDDLNQILQHLENMQMISAQINPKTLPSSMRKPVEELQSKLPALITTTKSLLTILQQSPDLFGYVASRHYMILLQNNSELRPTGGFLGSYASLELNGDSPATFTFQSNVYQATPLPGTPTSTLTTPYPLNELNKTYNVYNANWDPDFPTTGALLTKFYQDITGQPAQGVIAIDTSLITDILRITGPINFPQYSTTLTADNFLETVQYKVEKEYFDDAANKVANQPKKILADFIPVLLGRLQHLDATQSKDLLKLLSEALQRKTIQVYSQNQTVEQELAKLDVDGRLKVAPSDYLYLNNANIGGGKSSLNISEDVALEQRSVGDIIENDLTITRTHHGNGVWPDQDNNNYLRAYVPQGSQLISSGGLEKPQVTEEHGRTVIGGWFRTPVANKRVATIRYILPTSVKSGSYSLLLQRQSGENPSHWTVTSPLLGNHTFDLNTDRLLSRP